MGGGDGARRSDRRTIYDVADRAGVSPATADAVVAHFDGQPTLDVIDRGPGIPEATATQLFRPFFTTSEHGTGLGLYIARQLCEANQCTLTFEPVPGGGSCFRIIMPPPQALAEGLRPA